MKKKFPFLDHFFKKASFLRFMMNLWPVLRGAGIWIDYIKDDYTEMQVSLKLTFFNSNMFGVHFGGSLYAMVDPFVALLASPRLGSKYYCWDYSGKIRYVKPGLGKVSAHVVVSNEALDEIRKEAENGDKVLKKFSIAIKDEKDEIVALVDKVIYVRLKERFREEN